MPDNVDMMYVVCTLLRLCDEDSMGKWEANYMIGWQQELATRQNAYYMYSKYVYTYLQQQCLVLCGLLLWIVEWKGQWTLKHEHNYHYLPLAVLCVHVCCGKNIVTYIRRQWTQRLSDLLPWFWFSLLCQQSRLLWKGKSLFFYCSHLLPIIATI